MAVLTGISGMQIGDGAGGNIALSISTRVLRILSGMNLTYLTATLKNPASVNTGSVVYYKPELLQVEDYGVGQTAFAAPQVPTITLNMDIRRTGKWTYETFDLARLGGTEQVIGMIANGLAMSIQADLNAHFITYLVNQLTGGLKAQNIALPELLGTDPTITPEASRKSMNALKYLVGKLSKIYDASKLGVAYSEMITLLCVEADINIENAFWGQQGSIEIILNGLKTKKFGNVNYLVENMLNNKIDAGTAFSKDKALDTTNFAGVVLHNEAIAMPMSFMQAQYVVNPITGNPQYIMKYQFGIQALRPELIWGIVGTIPTNKKPIDNGATQKPATPAQPTTPITTPKV